ncbi:MAG TPA: hypothetical protein VEW03_15605 [Longimicrobiaceae bacterium]|nr:hypothetical protein [Longimicrobiaceae bacterium]
MPDAPRSSAERLVSQHPELRELMSRSSNFRHIKDEAVLSVDNTPEYIVRGDTLGSEEDLFVEALVRGAVAPDPDDPYRALFLELSETSRSVLQERLERRSHE